MTLKVMHLLMVALAASMASSHLFEDFKIEEYKDLGRQSGHARPCKGSNQNFTLEWSPKEVEPTSLQVSFSITPLMDHSEGKLCIVVYFQKTVYYKHCSGSSFHCDHINKYLPNACPFRKGVRSKGSMKINLKDQLFFPNPATYNVIVTMVGIDGTQFLCAELDVVIPVPPPDYEYD
ncbi:hypothetical protein NP493_735g03004 [Ridgeia piscesae]|uniref:MD-2-related lipid-recognition domain-containing protein n=1 Tax=Ridgeia piscesae TaxID=27915 RepID=A0AAD9KQ82_RIDPI|nr:hypothetical protein NP493_735g03004 [Ridgeia piscesae]